MNNTSDYLDSVAYEGGKAARINADATMTLIKDAVGLWRISKAILTLGIWSIYVWVDQLQVIWKLESKVSFRGYPVTSPGEGKEQTR